MPKAFRDHSYSSQGAFNRLLYLISAIAHSPGLADSASAANAGVTTAELLQESLQQMAKSHGVELPQYSLATIRRDVETLKQYGILPRGETRSGYYLGGKEQYTQDPPKPPRRNQHGARKATLSDAEMLELAEQGLTYAAIGKLAGVSRTVVGDALKRARQARG